MSNAREIVALRHHLAGYLRPDDITRLSWPSIAGHANTAITRGWTGRELAMTAMVGAYADGVRDAVAYVAAGIRELAAADPPREQTPQPPAAQEVLAGIHGHHRPAADHGAWVARVKAQHAERRRESAS